MEAIDRFLSVGYGYGSGDGYGLLSFNSKKVYLIDDVQTIITSVKGNIAKGAIVNSDLTLSDCYIAKVGNSFAHGKTVTEAVRDAERKHLQNIPVKERIAEFTKMFKSGESYDAYDFYEWHTRLTGSCEFGKEAFVRNKGIDLEKQMTVAEFIDLTIDQYEG